MNALTLHAKITLTLVVCVFLVPVLGIAFPDRDWLVSRLMAILIVAAAVAAMTWVWS